MAGVYISWPFCAQKCTYCNFASGVQPKELEAKYTQALLGEIARHEWRWMPETVYLGGGTPSSMSGEELGRILVALPRQTGPGKPWREATIETAPGSVTREKVRGWRAAGINRVSLGVQSFVKQELARTGRRHDADVVRAEIALLRDEGIDNINLDLISGLPGQTEASWRVSLEGVLALEVPHVSVYMLEVDEDSRLGSEILLGGKRYGASDTPSDDAIASFYETAVEKLAEAGIARYEISNFARAGWESLHNLKYWKREPYVGFGSDAHSFDGGERWQNVEAAKDYVGLESPVAERSIPNALEERFFVGLRMASGVVLEPGDRERYGAVIDRFSADGMLEPTAGGVRLTSRGIMVSNEIFQEFLTT